MSETLPALSGGLPTFQGDTWEDHVSAWAQVEDEMQDRLWMLAAVAASVTTVYGDQSIGAFASEVGCSARRIYDYAATYKAWQSRARSQILSFKHHTIAARAEDPDQAIEEAEVEEMSTRELDRKVSGKEPEPMQRCPTCGGRGRIPLENGRNS